MRELWQYLLEGEPGAALLVVDVLLVHLVRQQYHLLPRAEPHNLTHAEVEVLVRLVTLLRATHLPHVADVQALAGRVTWIDDDEPARCDPERPRILDGPLQFRNLQYTRILKQ